MSLGNYFPGRNEFQSRQKTANVGTPKSPPDFLSILGRTSGLTVLLARLQSVGRVTNRLALAESATWLTRQ